MTVEEIEIIVTAKVEEALKEFKKILPQIKQEMAKVQKEVEKVDFNGLAKQVKASGIDKELSKVKQKIKEAFNPSDTSGMKIQGLKQEIAGVSKETQKLKGSSEQLGNAYDLQRYKQKMQELKTETQNANKEVSKLGYVKYDTNSIQNFINSYKQGNNNQKVNTPNVQNNNVSENISTNVQPSQQSLSLWDALKAKIQQIKPQVQQVQNMFHNMSINPNTKQLDLVKYKISEIEEKLQNAKEGKIHLNTKDIVKAEAELERLNSQKNKLEGNSRGNMFSTIFSSLKKIAPQMNNIAGIAVKIRNNIKTWGTGIKTGIGQVIRYAGTLLSLQSIYSALSGSANSWLSSQNTQAQQLSANIEYMKYALGSALAPAIQIVVNLIYQALKGVQSLVYALTGVNIFANASAKAYSSMASNAKKAKNETKQLAGVHDEINNIQSNNDSGSGDGTTAPNMDLSGLDTQLSPWQQKLYEFFKPLIDSWNTYGAGLIAQIQTTAGQVVYLISSVWESFEKIITNGTVYSILENILAIIGNIAEAFANAWNYNGNGDAIVQNLANAFNNLLTAINNVVQSTAFQEWLNNCSDKFREISEKIASIDWQPLVDALMQIGQNVGTIALNVLSGLVDIFKWLAENPAIAEILLAIAAAIAVVSTVVSVVSSVLSVLNPILATTEITLLPLIAIILAIIAVITLIVVAIMNWDTIVQALANTWEWIKQKATEIFTAIKEFFVNIFNSIKDFFVNIWNSIKDFFVNLCISIYIKQQEIWNKIKDTISNVITAIKDFFINIWNSIKDFFVNLCVSIYTKSQEIWNNIKNAISNVINGIKTTISNVLNTIKSIWNNIWNGLKTTVTNIFNGIWNAIKKVINSILGGIEGMANGVVSGVNLVIRTLNKLKFTVPDWVPGMGGKTFGFNLSEINKVSLPRLAKGGVLYENTIVQAGEYAGARSNPEIVTPQNIMYDTMKKALSDSGNNSDNRRPLHITIQYLGKTIFDDTIEYINDKTRRTGKDTIITVGG